MSVTLPHYKYTTISPRAFTYDPKLDRYPGHRLGYRKRTNLMTSRSSYQPRCTCGKWVGVWRGSRSELSRRDFTTLHLQEIHKQGQLWDAGKAPQAQGTDAVTVSPSVDGSAGV